MLEHGYRYVRTTTPLLLLWFLSACSGGGGGGGAAPEAGSGDFLLVGSEPLADATVYLNDAIAFDFTRPVDLDSANATTVVFERIDGGGASRSAFVPGNFSLATRPGDDTVGRRLLFVPRYPTDNLYSDGGLQSGSSYRVQLVGGSAANGTALRSQSGRALERPATVTFSTVTGTLAPELFRNPKPGGPVRAGFDVDGAPSLDAVPLGLFGAPLLTVRLSFDQALDPNDVNVPVAFDPDPLVREQARRGRIYLEYRDPQLDDPAQADDFTWIPAWVDLVRNDNEGATVTLQPVGVLPNNAEVRVVVEPELRDIAGEDNLGRVGYQRVFATFRTAPAYGQQWNAIVEDFRDVRNLDPGAVFTESVAEVGPGYLRAGFRFDGAQTTFDYRPLSAEVVLNTAFTQVVPVSGVPFTVNGGVFRFRNVTIPNGVTVRGQGPNPMVWQVSGSFTVEGTLTVDGGDGSRTDTLRSANFAKAGGVGGPGGGNGGQGSPSGTGRDPTGESGRGPGQAVGRGGRGGQIACDTVCYQIPNPQFYGGSGGGSGGGGGSMATQGDIDWTGLPQSVIENTRPNTQPTANTVFQQVFGYGGAGCSGGAGTRTAFLTGGAPGDMVFTDSRDDNDFWGSAIDLGRQLRIAGELQAPTGGGGGGGGGDTCAPDGQAWFTDFSGGGGGGGGGVLIVQALQEIKITRTGRITADGGNGGGGEEAGASSNAGGGGGGAGGMIVLMSAKSIEIEAHGNEAQNRYLYGEPTNAQFGGRDFSFAVSADGGICEVGQFGANIGVTPIPDKYRGGGQTQWSPQQYDANPNGGLGGMGLVQLMAPPGDNSDGTNTILDDNIRFFVPGPQGISVEVQGLQKQQLIGWRGFPDEQGVWRDDDGVETERADGDIRPAPVLLPSPIQARSRARSRWIDTGRSQRRELAGGPDGLPRGIDTSAGAEAGPRFAWSGTDADGYARWQPAGSESVQIDYAVVVPPTEIAAIEADARHVGRPAYRVDLGAPVLGEVDRLVHHEAELLNSAQSLLRGYAVLGHDARTLWLDATRGPVPDGAETLRVRAKFFEVRTRGVESLGETHVVRRIVNGTEEAVRFPNANVRIGFAFHRDPDPADILVGRYPSDDPQSFVYDLDDPDFVQWLQAGGAPRYVMWDVTFDLVHDVGDAQPPALRANQPLPELRFLRLPFRF